MSLDRCHISIFAAATLLWLLVIPPIFPNAKLLYFAPLLVTLFYQRPLSICLFWALGCGLIVDLFADGSRLGLYASNYCAVTALLYSQKRNFFADSLSTLAIMTLFFSILSSIIQLAIARLLHPEMTFTFKSIASFLIAMPLIDSIYAFSLFTLPSILIKGRPRSGKEYFMP